METVKFFGAPGSPYTRKMLAYLRYKHIPYHFMMRNDPQLEHYPMPRVSLLPTFYFEEDGELKPTTDSTPIIRRFEAQTTQRKVIPTDPVLSFINDLLEDFADEWLTKAMFHYRWHYRDDIELAGDILPLWGHAPIDDAKYAQMKEYIATRQISRLHYVGSSEKTGSFIEQTYQTYIRQLHDLLKLYPFILGNQPSSCDFATYGQLTQLTGFDPTPRKIAEQTAPRTVAWTQMLEDLSGFNLPNKALEWISLDQMEHMRPLLNLVIEVYLPLLLANAEAAMQQNSSFTVEINGFEWEQAPFAYHVKCLANLSKSFSILTDEQKDQLFEFVSTENTKLLNRIVS